MVIWQGPLLLARLSWRGLLLSSYVTSVAWTVGLALVDGWQRGVAGRLATSHEYLHEVSGITDVAAMLREFSGRILDFQPDSWTTHVAGHPPGALLVFVGLDRIGLGGGGRAAIVCILVGAFASVAVPETVRLMGGSEQAARAAVPFSALFPGAVWVGASADGLFAGVAAVGVMLLARGTRSGAVVGGVVLTSAIYLSYGLVLLAPIAVIVCLRRGQWRLVGFAALGGAAVVLAFTASGFWWFEGYRLVVDRYYQGVASVRPYAYWVWANLAALVASAGPVVAVVMRRAMIGLAASWRELPRPARQGSARVGGAVEVAGVPPCVAPSAGHAVSAMPALRGHVEPTACAPESASTAGGARRSEKDPRRGAKPDPAAAGLSRTAESRRFKAQASTVSVGRERTESAARTATQNSTGVRVVAFGRMLMRQAAEAPAACLLPLTAGVAILLADLSGLSKAETERIWLPFAVWFAAGASLIPARSRRAWLVAQAATALVVNHLLLTTW
uniref:hypothetical protein n=1 Tax=Couchioplanes caeruleus TaxID=56438 RepID=UPI001B803B43